MRPRCALLLSIVAVVMVGSSSGGAEAPRGVLAGLERQPYYLPHMTWDEVEQYLKGADMALIPMGSLEQHGKHLPLGTDTYAALESTLRIGQRAHVVVAPVVLAGCSDHHMAFPGTITLSAATFEAVLWDACRSLIAHGFRKLLFYSGHGGNQAAMSTLISRINQETEAIAIDLGHIEFPDAEPLVPGVSIDSHAGIEETSLMLDLTPALVQMNKLESPKLTLSPALAAFFDAKASHNQRVIGEALAFRPERSGKRTTTRDMSDNGVFCNGDLKRSDAAIGRKLLDYRTDAIVRFIEEWRAQPSSR